MSATAPTVAAHWLYDPAQPSAAIRLDTPAGVAWLEATTTTRFAYPVFDPTQGYSAGIITVRKERRQRGGAYLVAYRRTGGHLYKEYLGPATTLTQARLDAAAALCASHPPASRPDHVRRRGSLS